MLAMAAARRLESGKFKLKLFASLNRRQPGGRLRLSTLEWAVLGALFLGIMIFCARLARRGLSTLEDERKLQHGRISEGKRKLAEDRKNISAHEHLEILFAGIEDMLWLDGKTADCQLQRKGYILELECPEGKYELELLMRERMLKSRHKVMHGRNLWVLRGPDFEEHHPEMLTLMASLQSHLKGDSINISAPEHIRKRLQGNQKTHDMDLFRD